MTKVNNERLDEDLKIPKKLFKEFNNISDGSFQLYILLILESKFGNNNLLKKDIISKLNIGDTTFHRNLKPLIKRFLVTNVSSYKKGKEKYVYKSKLISTNEEDFLVINSLFLNKLYEDLTKEELRMYIYLYFLEEIKKENKTTTINKDINKSNSTLKKIAKNLANKEYLIMVAKTHENDVGYSLNF